MSTVPTIPPTPICEAHNLSISYDADAARFAVQDITLSINIGEVVALLGPSGCGKSTLLRALIGLLKPTRGTVLAHGKPLTGMHPQVSLVFQSFALYPWLDVRENILVALDGLDLDEKDRQRRLTRCIELIGINGFEKAYPKELSGGMRQRVGFARALAREPELLCMDEPFSALDTLTAESLRSEIYRIVTQNRGPDSPIKSALLITHSIEEAVFLADRIVVMGTKPGHIRQIVNVEIPHPREYREPAFRAMVKRLHDMIVLDQLPEEQPPTDDTPPLGADAPTPIPPAQALEIFGLMEIVRDGGGRMDVFALDQLTDYDFGHTLTVVKAGELLGFLDTPKNVVALTELGNRFLDGDINRRKTLFAQQLRTLGTFRFVERILRESPARSLSADVVKEELVMRLPTEDIDTLFNVVVAWGRFGELFGYSPESETLYLDQPATV
ncbi:MAG TPA: nitrate/sulfonate/bicarbonate ABC transporter ATP-binding protein [Tepidisphaeraceae bacterium]|nr:nitrate/sulfonate/bicarbonate ABC transporter ATP-binding protein [Tepidisphaeraceae bacterium]